LPHSESIGKLVNAPRITPTLSLLWQKQVWLTVSFKRKQT
jgi:hypothetical protein